jgi:hypothetical protein
MSTVECQQCSFRPLLLHMRDRGRVSLPHELVPLAVLLDMKHTWQWGFFIGAFEIHTVSCAFLLSKSFNLVSCFVFPVATEAGFFVENRPKSKFKLVKS